MNEKHELKVVTEYLNVANDPTAFCKKYSTLGTVFYVVGWSCIFASTLAYLQAYEEILYISIVGFIGGGSIALGVWSKQVAAQAQVLSSYLSKELLAKRVHELST